MRVKRPGKWIRTGSEEIIPTQNSQIKQISQKDNMLSKWVSKANQKINKPNPWKSMPAWFGPELRLSRREKEKRKRKANLP